MISANGMAVIRNVTSVKVHIAIMVRRETCLVRIHHTGDVGSISCVFVLRSIEAQIYPEQPGNFNLICLPQGEWP